MNIPSWPKISKFQTNQQFVSSVSHEEKFSGSYKLLDSLGAPHLRLPPIIHVAGTNGKGSTIAILKAIYENAGYTVHCYTSPHLINYNERIYLAGQNITDAHINELIKIVKQKAEQINYQPNFFEGTTIMAMLAFSTIKADVLLLETGIGGIYDYTNIINNPVACVITPISYDHTDLLGSKLDQIAKQKAGIIKAGSKCIIAKQSSNQIYEILFEKAEELQVQCLAHEYDYTVESTAKTVTYYSNNFAIDLSNNNLLGEHQNINLGAAISTILSLNDLLPVDIGQIKSGIKQVNWPGRISIIDPELSKKIFKNHTLILDGAHNNSGAQALRNWLIKRQEETARPQIFVVGMSKNRNIKEFVSSLLEDLQPLAAYSTNVSLEPESHESKHISKSAEVIGPMFIARNSLSETFLHISNTNYPSADIIVTGSLFLVAECYKLLEKAL